MTIPEKIRNQIRQDLWLEADRLDWAALTASDKARMYTIWTETPAWGGQLAAFMDPRQVRVYIKDTLLKSYTRERMSDPTRIFRLLGLPIDVEIKDQFIKPHGRVLANRDVLAWGKANEWKSILMAIHERAFNAKGQPFGAVLIESSNKFSDPPTRLVVEAAAKKLMIKNLIWID